MTGWNYGPIARGPRTIGGPRAGGRVDQAIAEEYEIEQEIEQMEWERSQKACHSCLEKVGTSKSSTGSDHDLCRQCGYEGIGEFVRFTDDGLSVAPSCPSCPECGEEPEIERDRDDYGRDCVEVYCCGGFDDSAVWE